MAVDDGNSSRICNADMIRLYADQRAILLMRLINSEVTTSTTALVEEPEIAEGSERRARNIANRMVAKVGQEIVYQWDQ